MASSGATPIGYDDCGSGPATVLLHPFPFSRTIWAGMADALAAGRRVITVDARGFGELPPAGPFAIADLADDLAALLDRLDVARATVLGMSMGGYAALAFAARHRDRLSALVLADTRAASLRAGIEAMRDRPDRSGELGAIACPTLVVCGVDDQVTPAAEMKQIAAAIAGARFVPIADAGHLSHIEAPGAFMRAVTSFLDAATEARPS